MTNIKRVLPLLLFTGVHLGSIGIVCGAETVEGDRTEKGFVVKKGAYVDIPEDLEMKRVAKNVITPEGLDAYMARQFRALRDQLDAIEERLMQRLSAIEKKLGAEGS